MNIFVSVSDNSLLRIKRYRVTTVAQYTYGAVQRVVKWYRNDDVVWLVFVCSSYPEMSG